MFRPLNDEREAMVHKSSRKVYVKLFCIVASTILTLNNCVHDQDKYKTDDTTESFQVRIQVDYATAERDISPLLYGNNSKWLLGGEASFGRDDGIWNKQDNDINKNIHDWLVDSGITILRYGDGGNAEYFYWGWSILPFEERIATPVRNQWSSPDHYIFGVLEFIKLCETIKCEGIFIVNYNMGLLDSFYDPGKHDDPRTNREIGIQQAANWVEFMNIPAPAEKNPAFPEKYRPEYSLQKMPKGYFVHLRAQLGHPQPFGIKYWEIGNETNQFYGLEEYVKNTIEYSRAMKEVDPSIKIGWVDYGSVKELQLAAEAPKAVDFLASHDYAILEDKKEKIPFYGTQAVTRQIDLHRNGEYLIRFNAFARAYFGSKYPQERAIPPKMELTVDGHIIREITIDKNISKDKNDLTFNSYWYETPVNLSSGPHMVSLRMINDFMDKSVPDVNRRGRDVFVHSWLVEGEGEQYNILFPKGDKPKLPAPYFYYTMLDDFDLTLSNRQALISKYAPWLFVAQTESGYWPFMGTMWSALGEALMIMTDMEYDVKIRNFWQLYGSDTRSGVIHSGTQQKEDYHLTPEYYVNKMFSQHFGNKMISASVLSAKECRSNMISDDGGKKSIEGALFPVQDCVRVIASRDRDKVYIAIVNLHASKNAMLETELKNFRIGEIMQYTLRAKNPKEFNATNEETKDNVFIQSINKSKSARNIFLLPNSFTIIEFSKDTS